MKQRLLALVITILLVFGITTNAAAQSYSFEVTNEIVNVYWNDDGTVSLDYLLTFKNDAGGHVIDFVDLGLPNSSYDLSSIRADYAGNNLNISTDFQGDGSFLDASPYAPSVDQGDVRKPSLAHDIGHQVSQVGFHPPYLFRLTD